MKTPFDQDEALQRLLGESRTALARGNFVANVMRAARTTPQDHGSWARLVAWWKEGSTPWLVPATAMALAVGLIAWSMVSSVEPSTAELSKVAPPALLLELEEGAVAPLASLDEVDALLAMEDTSSLSDQEISFLLY